jgi:hypothetical protein
MVYILQDWIVNRLTNLPGIRTRDLWISSQHTQPLHHLGRHFIMTIITHNKYEKNGV